MNFGVFVNRTLNLKKIRYVGFDMDHTLVRYQTEAFEALAYTAMQTKLIEEKNYTGKIKNLKFDFNRAIRGLVIDKANGNLLKLNRFGAIRLSYHGTQKIDFDTQKKVYKSIYIDLSDRHYSAIDTSFSIAFAVLYAQLVDIKDADPNLRLPSYETIMNDLEACLDKAHRDGSLKGTVVKDIGQYIQKDPQMVAALEKFRKHDKKLFVLTNSDFDYSKELLDYSINPFLKDHKHWSEVFEFVITRAKKPRFFWDDLDYYKIDPKTGSMLNLEGPIVPGIYQGGCASKFTKSLDISGEDILYIGDHIYADVLRIKKDCNWRTALVVEELDREIESTRAAKPLDQKISEFMTEKEPFEQKAVEIVSKSKEESQGKLSAKDTKTVEDLHLKISSIDSKISPIIQKREALFNPHWGEVMRVGNEESYFARQVENYACIYMTKISDFLECSPRTYFRARRRTLPHEA